MGLEEYLKSATEYWKLVEGLVVIAIVLALPDGVRHLLTAALGAPEKREQDAPPVGEAKHV
jgi:branched-chain amino acid transport system permease protein